MLKNDNSFNLYYVDDTQMVSTVTVKCQIELGTWMFFQYLHTKEIQNKLRNREDLFISKFKIEQQNCVCIVVFIMWYKNMKCTFFDVNQGKKYKESKIIIILTIILYVSLKKNGKIYWNLKTNNWIELNTYGNCPHVSEN